MSKSYSFSLQKVFDYRKRVEEKKAIDLSRDRMNLNQKMNEFDLLEEKKEQALDNKNNKSQIMEKLDLNNLKIRKDYIVQINKELTSQAQKVEDANIQVDKSRDKLVQATKEKKMLEKLNERKFAEYKKEEKLVQSKKDDEVAGRVALSNRKKEIK